jgi:UPF0716 protein FxsA
LRPFFFLILLVELLLLVLLAIYTSWQVVLAVILLPALLGVAVLRSNAIGGLPALSDNLRDKKPIVGGVLDDILLIAAGILLIVPGILTGIVGLLLLVRPIRHLARAFIAEYLLMRLRHHDDDAPGRPDFPVTQDCVIEARVIDSSDDDFAP